MDWIYGIHTFQSMLKSAPERVTEIFVQGNRRDERLQKIRHLADLHGISVQPLVAHKLEARVNGRHQGVIARCKPGKTYDENFLLQLAEDKGKESFFLFLDGVTDPHNLGACLRSADAAGVNAVVVPKDSSAGLTPIVHKVASGAAESVPLITVTNLTRTLEKLQNSGIWVIGTTGQSKQLIYDIDLSGPIALVMGAEGAGVRNLVAKQCDYMARLPMLGEVESLNVSVATGVCLFEIVRQRM